MKTKLIVVALGLLLSATSVIAADPLPSWNDTTPKRAIITFVEKVTKTGSADFVPEPERIAVFDNDGTLWAEQPMYFQAFFVVDRIKELAAQHPEWKETEPSASVLRGDAKAVSASGEAGIAALMGMKDDWWTILPIAK